MAAAADLAAEEAVPNTAVAARGGRRSHYSNVVGAGFPYLAFLQTHEVELHAIFTLEMDWENGRFFRQCLKHL